MSKRKTNTIGILGGMGSYATVEIFRRMVEAFPAEKEWDRPRILIDNNCIMPSRVRAILYNEKREELLELCEIYHLIPTVGSDFHNFNSDIKIGLGINENLKISDYSIITRLKEKKHEIGEKYGA